MDKQSDIDWDRIQRMRFANADAEIAPNDSFTQEFANGDKIKVRKNSTSGDED